MQAPDCIWKLNFMIINLMLLLSCMVLHVDALSQMPPQVKGSGTAYGFSGMGYGVLEQIRTKIYPNGFDSFTVSFWLRNIAPASEPTTYNPGYNGALLSYWPTADGPSLASGYGRTTGVVAGTDPNASVFQAANYAQGSTITLFNSVSSVWAYNRTLGGDDTSFHTPGCLSEFELEKWYLNIYTWEKTTALFTIRSYLPSNIPGQPDVVVETVINLGGNGYETLRLPSGFFIIGQGRSYDPTLSGIIDEFCVFDRAITKTEMQTVRDFGCEGGGANGVIPNLVTYFTFDDDVSTSVASPNVKDEVTGHYLGVSGVTIMDVDGNVYVTDYNSAAGPVPVYSSAPLYKGRPLFVRNSGLTVLDISLTCKVPVGASGACDHITLGTKLPLAGKLCATSACTTFLSAGAKLTVTNTKATLFYKPTVAGVARDLDSFNATAYATSIETSALSTPVIVTVAVNKQPNLQPITFSLVEKTVQVGMLPQRSYLYTDDNDNWFSLRAQINSIAGNTKALKIYDCPACWGDLLAGTFASESDPLFISSVVANGIEITAASTTFPYIVQDRFRRVLIQHVAGQPSGNALLTLHLQLVDSFSSASAMTNATFNVISVNEHPTASPVQATLPENCVKCQVQASAHDREGDQIYYEISKFPTSVDLYQYAVNTMGDVILGSKLAPGDNTISFDQWVSNTLPSNASSCWNPNLCVSQIYGPPDLYPLAMDAPGAWQQNLDGDSGHQWLELYYDQPVYASQVVTYATWGPGSVVRIYSKPFHPNETVESSAWDLVYSGPNTMFQYCVNQPKGNPCAARIEYSLCPTQHLTRKIRLELEADDPARFFAMDAVLLTGSAQSKESSIHDDQGRVLVVPHKNYNGPDSFEVQVRDCSYFLSLQNLRGEDLRRALISITVSHVNQPPDVVTTYNAKTVRVDNTLLAQKNGFPLTALTFVDVDSVNLQVSFNLPQGGSMYVKRGTQHVAAVPNVSPPSYTFMSGDVLILQPPKCVDTVDAQIGVNITVSDDGVPVGLTTVSLVVILQCSAVSTIFTYTPSHTSISTILPAIGIALAVFCSIGTFSFRFHPANSSVAWFVNVIAAFGACLLLVSVIFAGRDASEFSDCAGLQSAGFVSDLAGIGKNKKCVSAAGGGICEPKIGFFLAGWVLAFGALYAKTYRVSVLVANKKLKRVATEQTLYRTMAYSIVIYTIFILVWFYGFPMRGIFSTQAPAFSVDQQVLVSPIVFACTSDSFDIFSNILIVSLGLWCVYGAYLANSVSGAGEVLGDTIGFVKEQKFISIIIYNSVIFGAAAFAMSYFVKDNAALQFIIYASVIFICVIVLLLLLFVPKVFSISKDPKSTVSAATETFNTSTGTNGTTDDSSVSNATLDAGQLAQIEELRDQIRDLKIQLGLPLAGARTDSTAAIGSGKLSGKITAPSPKAK